MTPSPALAATPQSAAVRERTLTRLDHARLTRLLDTQSDPGDVLADTLDLSELVDPREIAPDIVTMNSRVLLAEAGRAQPQELTLCYPEQAQPSAGRVSVLSPVGASLLGAQVGRTVQWTLPGGAPRQAVVQALLYQPEAAGDYLR
ncbi:GreA/GreB family elongation factor [Xenophilus sp. Marseille-Q4582]|uniref:GreA/GreB family elongation factor n=1 Tax=Xenophilus sp. Marseille-Q4582 TaxID=2866600 RepID=UPI001CE46D67|nr:GreA/GreB family elongation factor [Xenophilus sp. Marseille-Q4582]